MNGLWLFQSFSIIGENQEDFSNFQTTLENNNDDEESSVAKTECQESEMEEIKSEPYFGDEFQFATPSTSCQRWLCILNKSL